MTKRNTVSQLKTALLILSATICVSQLAAQTVPELRVEVSAPFTFVAFGDTRFTDPQNNEAANPAVRQALVHAIAQDKPMFVSIGGDIVYNGDSPEDWKAYDKETAEWKSKNIRVFPVLGNHDLHGDPAISLPNYFKRYPELANSRYYSVRAGNVMMLALDSSIDELAGPQGEWIKAHLSAVPKDVRFIVIVLHHPPYTSSTDEKRYGGGHSVRTKEQEFAKFLEARQSELSQRIVVFAGHVHNYERHQHGGVTYFVTGGGGAHAYPIERAKSDPFQSDQVNYHYLRIEVGLSELRVTMRKLELATSGPTWSEPDSITVGSQGASNWKILRPHGSE